MITISSPFPIGTADFSRGFSRCRELGENAVLINVVGGNQFARNRLFFLCRSNAGLNVGARLLDRQFGDVSGRLKHGRLDRPLPD